MRKAGITVLVLVLVLSLSTFAAAASFSVVSDENTIVTDDGVEANADVVNFTWDGLNGFQWSDWSSDTNAKWIWDNRVIEDGAQANLTRDFELPGTAYNIDAQLTVTADNHVAATLNGTDLTLDYGDQWDQPDVVVAGVTPGENTLALTASNDGAVDVEGNNPAGVIYALDGTYELPTVEWATNTTATAGEEDAVVDEEDETEADEEEADDSASACFDGSVEFSLMQGDTQVDTEQDVVLMLHEAGDPFGDVVDGFDDIDYAFDSGTYSATIDTSGLDAGSYVLVLHDGVTMDVLGTHEVEIGTDTCGQPEIGTSRGIGFWVREQARIKGHGSMKTFVHELLQAIHGKLFRH